MAQTRITTTTCTLSGTVTVVEIDYQRRSVWLSDGSRVAFHVARRLYGLDI